MGKLFPKDKLYHPVFVFIEKNPAKDSFQFCYVYNLYTYSTKLRKVIKYVVRAEAFNDCFGLKFYNSNFKKDYSKILDIFNAAEVKRLLYGVIRVIPIVLEKHPLASFCYIGSRTHDNENYIEGEERNQRYRVYSQIVQREVGEKIFEIKIYPKISGSIFINKNLPGTLEENEQRIISTLQKIYDFEI